MKIMKYVILEALLLAAMLLCGTAVMKILDWILNLNYGNVWGIGCKVGFTAWIILLAGWMGRAWRRNRR